MCILGYRLQQEITENKPITAAKLKDIYSELDMTVPSSLASYLSTQSKKSKNQKYIRIKDGLKLSKQLKEKIQGELNLHIEIEPSNNLFPIELLDSTRGYLVSVANQAITSYDVGNYDASLVMLRKLIEILIIELFEKNSIDNQIKNTNGDFFYLSDLITKLKANHPTNWNLSRNTRNGIDKVKVYGDLSAHNRRFVAKKGDLDKLAAPIRVIIQELVTLIDY